MINGKRYVGAEGKILGMIAHGCGEFCTFAGIFLKYEYYSCCSKVILSVMVFNYYPIYTLNY